MAILACHAGTIVIEVFSITYMLTFTWKQSILASTIGNLVSGIVGTMVMIFGMLFWHRMVDHLLPGRTFDIINWVATFVLMCLGSVFLETLVISVIYRRRFGKLFLPLLVGNFFSYLFIAIVLIVGR